MIKELRKQFQTISELRIETKTLQSDNLKLYEKVRYMQSYRDESRTGSSTLNSLGAGPSTKYDELNKYHSRYEESMNPFELFRGRVSFTNFSPLLSYLYYVGGSESRPST